MKKLMFAACVAFLGIAANAAMVNWAGDVGAYGTDEDCEGYVAYMFLASDTSSTFDTLSIDNAVSMAKAKNWSGLAAAAAIDAVACDGWSGGFSTDYLEGFPGSGEKVSGYAIVLNAADTADATHFSVMYGDPTAGTAQEYTLGNPGAMPTFNLTQGGWIEAGGADTPEPTSGLLLLIGVAGLALKRKRA